MRAVVAFLNFYSSVSVYVSRECISRPLHMMSSLAVL